MEVVDPYYVLNGIYNNCHKGDQINKESIQPRVAGGAERLTQAAIIT